jgi:hypothetical protein
MTQPAQTPLPSPSKLKATAAVSTTYLHNRIRLMAELAKKPRDQHVVNTIRAYLHIVRSLEDRYDLSTLLTKPERPQSA